jgi:hypothetical protein
MSVSSSWDVTGLLNCGGGKSDCKGQKNHKPQNKDQEEEKN